MADDKSSKPPAAVEEDFPDPDEDDLDELDDVLDQFSSTNIKSSDQPTPSGPGRPPNTLADPTPAPGTSPAPNEVDFASQLQAGMTELLGNLDQNPEMAKKFEELVKEMGEAVDKEVSAEEEKGTAPTEQDLEELMKAAAMAPTLDKDGESSKAGDADMKAAKEAEKSFQDTIRKTMERMQASGESAGAAAAQGGSDDILAQMLSEMEKGGFEGEGSDEDFSKMLMGMMEQLTNKEILYEPMKELYDKFPAWLEVNRSKTPADDLKRYEEQQVLVREIVGKFEEKGYRDDDAKYREYIVERMQKMQAAGAPPPDLVGDMNAAQEAMGDLDAGCPTQ